jgi:hypothetical protein
MAVPFVARNRYLTHLVRLDIRAKYENVCRYSGPPAGGEPARMAWSLYEFLRRRLLPLGIVDLAHRGERVVGMRLTDLGAVVLGAASPEDSEEAMTPLVVNPDFEILLFPEGRDHALVHRLDRFAKRTKTDHIHHYRLEEETVRRAVVAGMTGREILETLEANSRTPIPQNVAFSIREWSSRVRFLRPRRGQLLRAEDADTIRRILEAPDLVDLVSERIDERTIRLRERPDHPDVIQRLAASGLFLR